MIDLNHNNTSAGGQRNHLSGCLITTGVPGGGIDGSANPRLFFCLTSPGIDN
jgi:hypothetical protein